MATSAIGIAVHGLTRWAMVCSFRSLRMLDDNNHEGVEFA